MSIPFEKLSHKFYTGYTTSSTVANETTPIKPVIKDDSYAGAYRRRIGNLMGEGVYLEGADPERDGINFPTAVTEISATAPGEAKIVKLTDTLYVVSVLVANTSLGVYAVSIDGTTPTVGALTAVNAVDTDSTDICRLSDTTFAIAYRDEGGDDYLCARIGTVVPSTLAITMGTEKELTAAAITEDELSICQPRSGVVAVAYADGDDDLAVIACPYTATTFGTAGSVVEFDAAAPNWITACEIQSGYVFVAYADGGDSNKVHGRVASVSAAGAIGTPGTEKTIIDAAGTFLKARKAQENAVILGYIDASGDPAIVKCTTTASTGTTITAGTAVVMAAATATDFSVGLIDNTQGVAVWCDDAHGSDVGYAVRFSIAAGSTTTITADATVDKFVDASAKGGTLRKMDVDCSTGGKVVVIYNDADNDLGCLVGQYYENRIIDVRSTTTSAAYTFDLFPVFEYEATN